MPGMPATCSGHCPVQMALLMVGGRSKSLGWQLSMWGLLDTLCSKKEAGGLKMVQ